MQATYPAVYRDQFGEEKTVIENDGQTLRMVVRGVEFISTPFGSFDGFTPAALEEASQAGFILDPYHDLIATTLIFEVPMSIIAGVETVPSTLTVQIDLEGVGLNAAERHWADVSMVLAFSGSRYASCGHNGSFEAELLQIQRQLSADTHMHCCFGCAFSGYNPWGDGLWGMFCHRNYKEEYVQANNKPAWFRLNEVAAEYVQEIHLCPEFQRWDGKTGYRDPLHLPVINQP